MKNIQAKHWYALAFLVISAVFIFLRLYRLEQSLDFFNDIGRDFLVLYRWQDSFIPPLLGPQTSALPYNQSAIYFYLLMPMFVLSGQSFFSSTYTVIVFHVIFFAILYRLTLKHHAYWLPTLLGAWLLTIHPQMVIQNRFVWNPSFVAILVFTAGLSWLLFLERGRRIHLVLTGILTSLAVSLNYSATPFLLALPIITAVFQRSIKSAATLFAVLTAGLFFWNIPTVVFELRHSFLLTSMLANREMTPQFATTLLAKSTDISRYVFSDIPILLSMILLVIIFVFMIKAIFSSKFSCFIMSRQSILSLASLLAGTLLISYIVPISIHAHYIFAILAVFVLLIAFLPRRISLALTLLVTIYWFSPAQLQSYFAQSYLTVSEKNRCAQQICENYQQPLFMSVQSDRYPYHNGMEWKYLLLRNGCSFTELDTQIDQAEHMVVIVDDSEYSHGNTTYNELTQFGKSEVIDSFSCQENMDVYLLKRI